MTKKILVVDDDLQIRESLRKVLRAEGYEVAMAADGREGIEKFSAERIDLLLLDLNLPDNSGWDIFGTLTSLNPFLPIIIITGRQNQQQLAAGAGVGALMQKPLDVPRLLETVKELLAESPEAHLKQLAGLRQDTRYVPPPPRLSLGTRRGTPNGRLDLNSRHSREGGKTMRTTLHRQTVPWLVQHPTRARSTRAEPSETREVTEATLPICELKKILVPIDFSETSLKTLRYAAPLARQFGASLSLVHVVEKTSLASDLSNPPGGCFREDLAGIGLRILNDLRHREIGPDFPGQTLVRTGEPAHAIAQAAQELGIDLIVMATPELRRLRRALFGPMAERVARVVPCPVLTVNEKLLSKRASAEADLFSSHPHPESCVNSRLAAFRRWAGELFWRMATNPYVFYGSLLLAASLVVGAITREHEELWRTAAAIGIATVVVGLLHAWLETRSAKETLLPHGKKRANKP